MSKFLGSVVLGLLSTTPLHLSCESATWLQAPYTAYRSRHSRVGSVVSQTKALRSMKAAARIRLLRAPGIQSYSYALRRQSDCNVLLRVSYAYQRVEVAMTPLFRRGLQDALV